MENKDTNKKEIPDYQTTKDYRMHQQFHDEYVNYHVSLRLLKYARNLIPLINTCSLPKEIKYEIKTIRNKAKPVYEFINDYPAYNQSKLMRQETVSNLRLMEENLNIVAEHFHITFTEEEKNKVKFIRVEDPHLVVDVKEMVKSAKKNILTVASLTKRNQNETVSKRRISRYRNQVRELFDILKSNQRTLTTEIVELVVAKYEVLCDEHELVKDDLKDEDLVSWKSLIKKINDLSIL